MSLNIIVDENIAGIVKYINHFIGLRTLYSCEKRSDGNAYVQFIVTDSDSLVEMLLDLGSLLYNEVINYPYNIEVSFAEGLLRYTLVMPEETRDFINKVRKY